VTTVKLAPDAVDNSRIADNAIQTENILDANVTTVKLAPDAVDNSRIADNAIQTENILDVSVTDAKIAPGAADQILRTDPTGADVTWVDMPALGTTEVADLVTITGIGTDLDPFKVEDSG